MYFLHRSCQLCIFILLTILTQIGGIAYLGSLFATSRMRIRSHFAKLIVFIVFYVAATICSSWTAPTFGRVSIPCLTGEHSNLAVRSVMYCALNRNYVSPDTLGLLLALADDVNREFPGTTTMVLDGNFPFVDGFPLLPHLSHNDGRKVDIALYYKNDDGRFVNRATRSPIGYFAFEQPSSDDERPCEGRYDIMTARWDLNWLQSFFPAYQIESDRTAFSLRWLVTEGVGRFNLEKIFIEPHLRNALGVKDDVIRFQGCRAARHDDHIHIQIREPGYTKVR